MKKLPAKRLTFIDQNTSEDIDWHALEAIYSSIGRKRPFHKASRLRRAFSDSYSFCMAVYDDKLIGCGRTLSDGQVHGWIHDLAVLPEYQRQGVGQMVLNRLIEQLAGVRYLGLLCSAEHTAFYEKSGFQTGWTAMTLRQKTR